MTGKRKWLACALITLAIVVVSAPALAGSDSPGADPGDTVFQSSFNNERAEPARLCSQSFFGNVTIDEKPVPGHTNITVTGKGVWANTTRNLVVTSANGSYGSSDDDDNRLVAEGCIEDGAPLRFFVNGVAAEVCDAGTGGPWQSAYPFHAGEVTNLDVRVLPVDLPPDSVFIHTLGVTVSNTTLRFFQSVTAEKNPWVELRLTGGMFEVGILATGYHDFSGYPILGRNAKLGIYENGNLVAPEVNVAFGSRSIKYAYIANETRTFDILIYVPDQPEIREVRRVTVFAGE